MKNRSIIDKRESKVGAISHTRTMHLSPGLKLSIGIRCVSACLSECEGWVKSSTSLSYLRIRYVAMQFA